MPWIAPLLIVSLALAAALPRGAAAQVEARIDNDLFGVRGADDAPRDYEYTHGARVTWRNERIGRRVGRLGRSCSSTMSDDGAPCLRLRYEVGQKIFTPRRDAAEPVAGERPYAGWLYGAAGIERSDRGGTRTVSVEVGVTGPPSLAEPVQTELHRLAGYRPPLGWRNQLRFEPAAAVRYREERALLRFGERARVSGRLAPEWGAAAGTLWTGAHAGVGGRVGWGRGIDNGGSDARGAYLFGGARGEWVARNLFLDGNTFRGGPRVEKRPFVGEAEAGVGFRWRRFELRYRTVFRGREYRTQEEPHRYGSVDLVLHPRR